MFLTFSSPAVREVCERGDVAYRKLGLHLARALQARLADLRAARTLSEFPFPLIRHGCSSQPRYSLVLYAGFRLDFEVRDSGPIEAVANIKIISIGDPDA